MSTDPKAFWASLDPDYAITLIDAAPRVAGPWKRIFPSIIWVRETAARVSQEFSAGRYIAEVQAGNLIAMEFLPGRFVSVEAAMLAADAWLLANGWLLRG